MSRGRALKSLLKVVINVIFLLFAFCSFSNVIVFCERRDGIIWDFIEGLIHVGELLHFDALLANRMIEVNIWPSHLRIFIVCKFADVT